MIRLRLRPAFHRHLAPRLILAGFIVAGGAGTWWFLHRAPQVPPPPAPTQHIYPSDDGHLGFIIRYQRIEFDFSDISQWRVKFANESSADRGSGVQVIQLNNNTYVPTTSGGVTATLSRQNCAKPTEPCKVTVQFTVFPSGDSGMFVPPNDLQKIDHP
jgi:hypothetical protein